MEGGVSSLNPDYNHSAAAWPSGSGGRHQGTVPGPTAHFKDLTGLFLMVSLNVLALLANISVLVVVVKAPHLRKFTFVCHLCGVDLLCAVLLMPLGIVSTSPYFSSVAFAPAECQALAFLNVALIAASIFSVTAISVERYYYIVHPMRYEVKMTLKLTAAVVAAVWAAAAALGLAAALGWPPHGGLGARCSLHWSHGDRARVFSALFAVACFCLPAAAIFAVYCNVYKVARLAARQHGPLPSWTDQPPKLRSDSINSQTNIIATTRDAPRRPAPGRTFGGGKAALTLVLIVGQFLICWLPYFALHLHQTLDAAAVVSEDLEEAVTWLAYSSFAINPFFYGLLNRQIREELCKLRRCYSARRPAEPPVSSHDASGHENFLQFLHRTSSTLETRASLAASPRSTVDQTGFRIPGQIPEEFG